MALMMVAHVQPVSRELVIAASTLVKLAHPAHESLHRAIDKAQTRLITMPWAIDNGVLAIPSHSHPTEVHYTQADRCDCPTTKGVCWHIGAWHILSAIAATGRTPVAALPLPDYREVDDLAGIAPTPFPAEPDEEDAPAPFTPRRAIVHLPPVGSEWERAEALANELCG